MEMSFQQYINNPLGKKNAVFSQRDMYRSLYTEKFDKVFLREAGRINYTLYVDKSIDQYVIHIKVPSETIADFYYDAVILFYSNDAAAKASNSLQDYFVKFYSNDPAFVFTYLRVFLKNGMFLEDLAPKTSKEALTKDPKEKNPYEIPGYSKILYFAYLFMKNKNLFSKNSYLNATKYSSKKLLNNVEHSDTKIAKRQEEGVQQAKREAREKKKARSVANAAHHVDSPSGNITMTRPSRSVKTTPVVKSTKKTSTVKKTKSS